jgi:hypothetical protein
MLLLSVAEPRCEEVVKSFAAELSENLGTAPYVVVVAALLAKQFPDGPPTVSQVGRVVAMAQGLLGK